MVFFAEPISPPIGALVWPVVVIHVAFFLMTYLTKAKLGSLLLVIPSLDSLAVVIYVILDDSCDSAAAYAKSISMVSASIIKEGYTFMFVCLVAVALIVQLRITRLTTNRAARGDLYDKSHYLDKFMQYAIPLVCLTAVLPDRSNNCKLYDDPKACGGHAYPLIHEIHIIGIAGGMLLTILAGVPRAISTVRRHAEAHAAEESQPLKAALGVILLCALLWVYYLIEFLGVDTNVHA